MRRAPIAQRGNPGVSPWAYGEEPPPRIVSASAKERDAPQIVVWILYTTLGQLTRIAKLAQETFLFATVRLMLSSGYAGEELKYPVFPEPDLAERSVMKVPGHRFPWQ